MELLSSARCAGLAAAALSAMLIAAATPALAESASAGRTLFDDVEDRALSYVFQIDGERVGIAEGRILRTDPRTWRVEARYAIAVELLGVDVYQLELEATETYRGARLVALRTRGAENGTDLAMSGEAAEDGFRYRHNGEPGLAAADIVPSTQLWRRDLLRRTRVLHAIEGEPFDRAAEALGDRTFETEDGPETLSGYHIETPYETAELWFDAEGLLQRATLDRMGVTLEIRRTDAEGPAERAR